MLQYSFLKDIDEYMKIYRNYPLPVLLCDKTLRVYYSNPLAKSLYPHFAEMRALTEVLAEFSVEELFARLEENGSCTLVDAIPLSTVQLVFTPILKAGDTIGAVLTIVSEPKLGGSQAVYLASKTAQALSGSMRGAIHNMFGEMDALALKADFAEARWVKAGLNRIGLDSYRILRVTGNLVEYSRLQSGAMEPHFEAVDVCEHLGQIEDALLSLSESIGIPLKIQRPQQPCIADMDLGLIETATLNLLHNSFYYTREGNEVEFSIDVGEEFSTVMVRDRGAGIPAEELEHIWKPFYTGRAESSGLGLGLTLVQAVVRLHHGTIEVDSKPGEGTAIAYTLPRRLGPGRLQFRGTDRKLDARDRFSRLYVGLADTEGSPYR